MIRFKRSSAPKGKPVVSLICLVFCLPLLASAGTVRAALAPLQAPPEGFAHATIKQTWERDDAVVASGRVTRPWMWGPGPFYTNYEPYAGTPGASHLVQYFDKGRLEVNDPSADPRSPWFVTSGRLVSEMVAGEAEVGGGQMYRLGPANLAVAGDGGNAQAASYASFRGLLSGVPAAEGRGVDTLLDASGKVSTLGAPPSKVTLGRREAATGHHWADVFWRFANSPDRPARFDWLYTLGYPITEPYWVQVPVSGKPQMVLVQLFERRSLTFNPANPSALQVEMGNVGRHYFQWHYSQLAPADLGTTYQARIEVGPKPGRITRVQERIELVNNTGAPLSNVMLHAPWNHWDGAFRLLSITSDGQPLATAWREEISLDVRLPAPVPPGGRLALDLNIELHPRPVGGRTGYDTANDILGLGDMLPTVAPWENGGWSVYPYSELGDLGYYTHSDYKVDISSAGGEKLVAGGTGDTVAYDEQSNTWRFEAPHVRDAAYVVSPRFVNPLTDSSMRRQVGDTRVLAYFLPEYREQAQQQLNIVAPALEWLGRTLGDYPFSTYTVAQMGVPKLRSDNYAQEYPTSYFIPTNWLSLGTTPGTWPWYTPVHEVAHQWFYSTIANNQLADPWLDEALATYITAEYVRDTHPNHYNTSYASMTRNATRSLPVSAGIFSGFANEAQYSATIYDSGTLMLHRVRGTMGEGPFYAALREYYETYRFKKAKPTNLLALFQKYSKADLRPIWDEYLTYY
ncbi:MAG TPA: M1 family aminopeptidase [Chloroflexia bacterium]